jgi:23S rRNA pseudouridine2604 synthase
MAEPATRLAEPAAEPPPSQPAAASVRPGLAREPPRLSRLVSEMTGCSRREADEWIENGWISVDGLVINRLGARVSPKAAIEIRDAASKHRSASVSILFHKPTPAGDAPAPTGRETAVGRIRGDNRWVEDDPAQRFVLAHLRGLAPAGALDASAGGMLVFTQEGSVARRLAGGDARVEKEYHVFVEGVLAAGGIERLRHGLVLDGIRLRPADVSWLAENRLRIVLRQSLPRQIPRMCALLGLRVRELRCVRIGSVSLGRLPPGAWRYLRADERF